MPIDESRPYKAFYNDNNEFCYQDPLSEIVLNPTTIFTGAYKAMNGLVEKIVKHINMVTEQNNHDRMTRARYAMLGHHYVLLDIYFDDPVSKKYIDMLDKSEWTFWFNHVITQLRKLQTSPQWKQHGKLDMNDKFMLEICRRIFKQTFDLKLSEKSSRVPSDFYYALAGCVDVLSPRLPHRDFFEIFKDICGYLSATDSKPKMWKMIEESGLLVQFLRCSTMPLDDMNKTYSFYVCLIGQLSLIEKKFKVGQPCGDMVHNILSGKEGHSNPDPKVLNFLQSISKLADMTQDQDPPLDHPKKVIHVLECHFCKTEISKYSERRCSQCRRVSYCSKKCQRNDWNNHKKYCRNLPLGYSKKVANAFDNLYNRFMIDHDDEITAKIYKTISETGHKAEDLMLEVDFDVDESGVAPALSDPPQFEILSLKDAHEYLRKKYANVCLEEVNDILNQLSLMLNNVKKDEMLYFIRSNTSYKMGTFMVFQKNIQDPPLHQTKTNMSDTSNQKVPIEEPCRSFYRDDNTFCYQDHVLQTTVNPTKIFTNTIESMNATVKKHQKDGMTKHDVICHHYYLLDAYFLDDASEKYIVMLDESEWKFWFIHVSTQLRKFQTSPQWKEDGKPDKHDKIMLDICCGIFQRTFECQYRFKLLEKSSLQVPKEFFHALASCIDTVRPRLPHNSFVDCFVYLCSLILVFDSDGTMLKMMETSGLLVHAIRCSTVPLDNTGNIFSFYHQLSQRLSFIGKKFKAGEPCGDIVRKILAGKEGHANPDPKVLNFLQTISTLADKTNQDVPFYVSNNRLSDCHFCRTTGPKDSIMKRCSQCRKVYYCSKKCQKQDWKNHKAHCQQVHFALKNVDKYEDMARRFLMDYSTGSAIKAKINKTAHESGCKKKELIMELDFVANEYGISPALLNPPQFEILYVHNAHEYFHKKYPNGFLQELIEQMRDLKETEMLFIWRSPELTQTMVVSNEFKTKVMFEKL